MSIMFGKGVEKRRHEDILRHDEGAIGSLCSLGDSSPQESMENWVDEKRARREIANSNERRRMQSINSGFAALRTLLPQSEGEKLSKAAILQQTTEYIYQLEQEKSRLLAQNCQLKRLLGPQKSKELLECGDIPLSPDTASEVTVGGGEDILLTGSATTKKSQDNAGQNEKDKRKGMLTGEAYTRAVDRLRREVNESRSLLEAERKLRLKLEEQIHALEAQLQLQIEVPEVDNSEEITAHILGRKPNPPPKVLRSDSQDEDSDLLNVARSASACASGARWNPNKKSIITAKRNAIPALSPSLNRRDSVASPTSCNDQNQVQFVNSQGSIMTSLPAHLVLDDRPSSRTGSLLEAAMMAEPKVEVELASRVPSPALSLSMAGGPSSPASGLPLSSLPVLSFQLPPHLAHLSHLAQSDGPSSPIVLQHGGEEVTFVDIDTPFGSDSKSYLAATSRQNLETIVEAIRHLEGDHLFNDDSSGARKGQLVEVEIDTEGEAIGCSLVVTSTQDDLPSEDVIDEQETPLQLTISGEQEVGEMITVSSETEVDTQATNILDDDVEQNPNVIVVKRM